jgi:hypothetical protein
MKANPERHACGGTPPLKYGPSLRALRLCNEQFLIVENK